MLPVKANQPGTLAKIRALPAHEPASRCHPATLGRLVRSRWLIENQVHWVRDTAYDEDRHAARTGNGPINLACLRNTAISRHRAN